MLLPSGEPFRELVGGSAPGVDNSAIHRRITNISLHDEPLSQDFYGPRGYIRDIDPASLRRRNSGNMRSVKRPDPAQRRSHKADIEELPGPFGCRAHCGLSG